MKFFLFLPLICFLVTGQNVTLSDEEVQFFINIHTQERQQSIQKKEMELDGLGMELNNTFAKLAQNRRLLLDGGDTDGSQTSQQEVSLSAIACSEIVRNPEGQIDLTLEQSQLLKIIQLKAAITSQRNQIEKEKQALSDYSKVIAYNLLSLDQ